MFYYLIWVRSNKYHGDSALTYSSDVHLSAGSIVKIELQKSLVLGVVEAEATKPHFKTKQIIEVYDLPPIPKNSIRLMKWLKQYYPAPLGTITQQFLPVGFSLKQLDIDTQTEKKPIDIKSLPPLTKEQVSAFNEIGSSGTYLLHGITGSGKTRLYCELANQAISQKKSSIILTPEISLLSQLYNNFKTIFGDRVVLIHSKQTPSERQAAWLKILKATKPVIVIGPRSALFSPINNLGLIVIDEEHENAYKQEQAPQYQTNRVASYLASINKAKLILGSATPLVGDYYMAEQKNRPIIQLTQLASPNNQPAEVIVIDHKDHSLFSQTNYLSDVLIKAIEKALSRGEQSLLYLNRRGTARLALCENCGWQALCPHCDIPLTYHGDSHNLRCHSCSFSQLTPTSCPVCKFNNLVFKTAGTKAIIDEVKRIFPGANIARFDTDNTKAESFEQNYLKARDGQIDILVGTQILAKGLDLPKLSTLGVLLADTSLYIPDFTSQERTYQLINQVIGRVGRGHVAGKAIIQTYNPSHPIISQAIKSDYLGFYKTELETRKKYFFPPFCHLLKITVKRASIKSAEKAANDLKSRLLNGENQIIVEGPAPAFYEKLGDKYRWQLVVKSIQRNELLKIINNLPANYSYDIDPMDLL